MSALIVPRVNLNGTHVDALIDARAQAREALDNAIRALAECLPHGRDYQHDMTGIDLASARALHSARVTQLATMKHELYQEMDAIDAQRWPTR